MGKGLDAAIKPEEYFKLSNGRILKNLYELLNALKGIDDETFAFHVNENKNDFGNWVRDIFKDEQLAESIFSSKSKDEIINAVESKLFAHAKVKNPALDIAQEKHNTSMSTKLKEPKKLIKSYPFTNSSAKSLVKMPEAESTDAEKSGNESKLPLGKIEEILLKEKEIAKREEKIEEIEARIEMELADLSSKKEPRFFSKEFVQGILVGLLAALIIGLAYIKFLL